MIKTIINIVLTLLVIGLIYFLANMIYEPIDFQAERAKRERAVATQLIKIRTAQQAYKGIVGQYAHTFDTLKSVLSTDSFKIVTVFGDADVEGSVVRKDISYVKAIDSMSTLGINLDSLDYVPYGNEEAAFKLEAAVIEYQSTEVPVVQVSVPIRDYMGPYADVKYMKFDNTYDPNKVLKFGDMNKPSTNGSWKQFGKEDKN